MKKHTFFDSGILRILSATADLIVLNLLFIFCSLPIFTIGPALTAMHYVTLRMVRNEESHIVKDFFRSFRQNISQGIIIHIVFSVISIILAFNVYVLWNLMEAGWIYKYLLILTVLLSALHIMTFIYVFPVLAQFNNTIRNTIKNARFMALKHFSFTLAMFLVTVCPIICALFINYFLEWEIVIFALIGFALIAYFNSRFLVRIFDQYITDDNA